MTLSSDISTTSTALSNIKTAIINKGVTPSGNITTYAAAINNIPTSSEFQLTRFKDDTNTEIGTHYMNFTDGNGNEYKVILLDAQYRGSGKVTSTTIAITNLPIYSNLVSSNIWQAHETATANTQLILDFCTAGGYTSTACSHCRSKSFTIGGVTYYGQLPNLIEVERLAESYNEFDALDTSASSSSMTFSEARNIWSSSQSSNTGNWRLYSDGAIRGNTKNIDYFVCPVLEIPLT